MALQQITADDIAGWSSLRDIANSFEKRGLKPRPNLGEDNKLILQLADDEFIALVNAGPEESATDFKPDNRSRHTNLVATNDFQEFTFLTRMRSWEGQQHGRIKHQKISFTKDQFTRDSGEKNTILKKLNSIEFGSSAAIYDTLYDTQQVVKEFYQEFEDLRMDLVQEVSDIPDDRGDAKHRYVQVILDRMIFLYFIQEKRLLNRDPDYLHEQPGDVVDDGEDRYENFYRPLFFEYLAEDKQNPDFGSLPYLNGGLFAKNPVEEEFSDVKLGASAEKTNKLFDDILDFLSNWNWNVDERLDIVDPKNLSPAILGHIFEQTVHQKEMGAYYTPEEITGFMSRRTIHPYLLEQLNDAVDAEYNEMDDVFGFPTVDAGGGEEALADGGTMTQQVPTDNIETKHVEILYHDILKECHVLDPAVGSGAFLLAAQDVLVDIYLQCIEYFQELEKEGKGWELESRTRDELENINEGQGGASLYAKRTVILNNLYGVDIDEGAVEICKLRLWLSMVADIEDEPNEVEPLPNIDFNIRQGNSLIGFTHLVEVNSDGNASLTNYGGGIGDSVEEKYVDIIEAVEKHRAADSGSDATNWRKEAERRLSTYREDLNQKIKDDFESLDAKKSSDIDLDEYSPFHWVLEFATVYKNGGFDVLIGNPPWDVLTVDREHFFPKYDPQFRTRSPSEKDEKQSELLQNPEIKKAWEEFQNEMIGRSKYYTSTNQYTLQEPSVGGNTVSTEQDLSLLFFERVTQLASNESYVTLIMPGNFFLGATAKDLRDYLTTNTEMQHFIQFENKGIFEDLHRQYRFSICTFKNSGSTDMVSGGFSNGDTSILLRFETHSVDVPVEVLRQYSPESKLFPFFRSQRQINVLSEIIKHPPLNEEVDDAWQAKIYMKELDRANDSDRLFEDSTEGEYPIYEGKNIHQFTYDETVRDVHPVSFWGVGEHREDESAKHRIRMKNLRSHDPDVSIKKAIYQKFNGTGSQIGFVNDLLEQHNRQELSKEDVLLDCTEYRIGIRNVSNAGNERTLIASVLPKRVATVHTLMTVRPYIVQPTKDDLDEYPMHTAYKRTFDDEEMFVFLGMLNSIVFDYLIRSKVDNHIVQYKLTESQMPRLTENDEWFEYIWRRAAKLNCYGDEFSEMRERLGGIESVTSQEERQELQAEIDAAAMHAYGLDQNDVKFILNDFNRVSDPQIMTEGYFESVLEKYDELEAEGP